MKKNYIFFALCILIVSILVSCEHPVQGLPSSTITPPANSIYTIFGDFYGSCPAQECVNIFKLQGSLLFKDTLFNYPNGTDLYKGGWQKESAKKLILGDSLKFDFPPQLLTMNTHFIGMPDANGQGGIYIETNISGSPQFWLIDKDTNNLPQFLIDFVTKVNGYIILLRY